MRSRSFDAPPVPSLKLTRLHIWVATYPDGSESIISADLPLRDLHAVRHVPLLSARRETAEALGDLARHAQNLAVDQSGCAVSIRLVTFAVEKS